MFQLNTYYNNSYSNKYRHTKFISDSLVCGTCNTQVLADVTTEVKVA